MKLDNKGVLAIGQHEGVSYNAYRDIAGIWTIGRGMTYYPKWFKNGRKVQQGDKITVEEEELLFKSILRVYENGVSKLVIATLNQNQFNALVSFAYNLGTQALVGSTLLKKVNKNPNDASIKTEFLKWNKARVGGVLKPVQGLSNRRAAEAQMYFS